jgi:hypothetical protein
MAVTARATFLFAYMNYIPVSGVLSDELFATRRGVAPPITSTNIANIDSYVQVDARLLDQTADWSLLQGSAPATDGVYGNLQQVRGLSRQAIGALAAYAPMTSANTRGELYALMGYAELMLADLYCSGIPLSTLDFGEDFTYRPGSTTQDVYQHAITLFDTALTLAADSAPIVNLARVGRGRAYLALGEYAAAGTAVHDVPLEFQYTESALTCGQAGSPCPSNPSTAGKGVQALFSVGTQTGVADREGGVGLPFVSSGDPRTAVTSIGQTTSGPLYFPNKFTRGAVNAVVLASGLEAQLIAAEAVLQAGDGATAMSMLGTLRAQNTVTASMPPLTDPGTFDARVDTLFKERAEWLFSTGERQGDLRRLARVYGRNAYPTGTYPQIGGYGTFIDAPLPAAELANPLFHGCLSRD